MIELKAKLWRNASVAAIAVAGVALTACGESGESGEAGATIAGEAGGESGGESGAEGGSAPAAGGEAGEAAIGETGGEGGEAGANTVYAGLSPDARTALRLEHLKGFLLVAKKELEAGRPVEAGALVGQGALEVHTPAPDDFGALDIAVVKAASTKLMEGAPDGGAALDRAIAAIEAQQASVTADTVRRMLRIGMNIYNELVTADGVDPIEYQHSFGSVMAAKDALERAMPALKRTNAKRASEAQAELDKLVALYPSLTAPQSPTSPGRMQAQASRVELALSGF
jgi:hypothetical protein